MVLIFVSPGFVLIIKPPFNQWRIENVALEGISQGDGLHYLGRIAFDRYLFPPYVPRKALDKKSFPSHDACTYVFGLDVNALQHAATKFVAAEHVSPSSLVTVDSQLVIKIRESLLKKKAIMKRAKR